MQRSSFTILTAGVVAGLMAPAGGAATASDTAATRDSISAARGGLSLTVDRLPREAHAGQVMPMSGHVKHNRKARVKAKLKLQHRSPKSVRAGKVNKKARWVTIGKAKTTRKGAFSTSLTLPEITGNLKLRVKAKTRRPRAAAHKRFRIRITPGPAPAAPAPTGPAPAAPVMTAPSQVRQVSAVAGNRAAVVSWKAPARNGGAAVTSYQVQASTGVALASVQTVPASARTATVTGLTNGSLYSFTVVAVNSKGTSPTSTASNQVAPYVPGVCNVNGETEDAVADGFDAGPIQDAAQAAGNNDTTITIQGTCNDYDIDIGNGQTITLKGLPTGGDNHTIDAQRDDNNPGRVLSNKGTLTITGSLTLTGGNANPGSGGGIHNGSGGKVTLTGNAIISNNDAYSYGGAIYNGSGAAVELNENARISNNKASDSGAIENAGGAVELSGNTIISNNKALNEGGGIYNYNGGTVELNENARISNNKASVSGAIENEGGTVELSGNATITNNQASEKGGGIHNYNAGTVNLKDTATITGNKAEIDGGGIYISSGTLIADGTTIYPFADPSGDPSDPGLVPSAVFGNTAPTNPNIRFP